MVTPRRVLEYISSRSPTATGDRYTVSNPSVLLRDRGRVRFTNGAELGFDRSSKADIVRIVDFALATGTLVAEGDSQRERCFVIDPRRKVVIVPQGLRFALASFEPMIFEETFLTDSHFVDFDMAGKVVVDAGGFVGDTALYYANQGATVYSFEPDERNFGFLEKNLRLNPDLAPRVTPAHLALGRDGTLDLPRGQGGGASVFGPGGDRQSVESLSLRSALDRFAITEPFLLHLDVKGLEADLLQQEEIARFGRLRVEYQTRFEGRDTASIDDLLASVRRQGFRNVRVYKHNRLRFSTQYHGVIDARK